MIGSCRRAVGETSHAARDARAVPGVYAMTAWTNLGAARPECSGDVFALELGEDGAQLGPEL